MRNKIKIKGVASSHVDMGCEKGQTSPLFESDSDYKGYLKLGGKHE